MGDVYYEIVLKTYFNYKIKIYDIREIKKHVLNQKITFQYIYGCSKLIIYQVLSALEVRKRVVGYVLLPGNLILQIC